MKEVKFSELAIGDKFGCWGDHYLNYDFPKWCDCVKTEEEMAEEIDGIRFPVDKDDTVLKEN